MVIGDRGILLDVVKGVCLTVAIFVVYLQVPLLGIAAGVIVPLPILYYQLKSGQWIVGVSAALVAALILALSGGFAVSLVYLIQAGLLSVLLAYFLSRGYSNSRAIASAVLSVAATASIAIAGYGIAAGVDFHRQVTMAIKTSFEQTIAFYRARGATGEDVQLLKEGLEQVGALFGQIYPAMFLVTLAAIAGINLLLLRRFRNQAAIKFPESTLSSFKNPEHLVWGVIAAGFALLISNDAIQVAALNVIVVAGFLYFIQGMAVVMHFFATYSVPVFFRIFFYVLLVLQAYLAVAVMLLGLFDLWADFRRPRIHKNL